MVKELDMQLNHASVKKSKYIIDIELKDSRGYINLKNTFIHKY